MTRLPDYFAAIPAPVSIGTPPPVPGGLAAVDMFAQLLEPIDLAAVDKLPKASVDVAADLNPLLEAEVEKANVAPERALDSIVAGLLPFLAVFAVPPKQVEEPIEQLPIEPMRSPLPSNVVGIAATPEFTRNESPQLAQIPAPPSAQAERSEPQESEAQSSDFASFKTEVAGPGAPPLPWSSPVTRIEAPVAPLQVQFELRQLDLARNTMWLDDLARDIVAAAQTKDQLSFRLAPRELGLLDVNLSTSDAGLSVRMSTSTEDARAIVAAHQPRLLDELRGQGIRVAEAEVNTGDHRQSQRNIHDPMPFIEVAAIDERGGEARSEPGPQGRFA